MSGHARRSRSCFWRREWGELVERGHVYILPAPKQLPPQAQSHCFVRRTVPLLITSDHLPLSSALPSSTSTNTKERTTARSSFAEPMFAPQRPFEGGQCCSESNLPTVPRWEPHVRCHSSETTSLSWKSTLPVQPNLPAGSLQEVTIECYELLAGCIYFLPASWFMSHGWLLLVCRLLLISGWESDDSFW